MSKLVILCVEDESEVRDVLVRDLEVFSSVFRIEAAEDVEDAWAVVEECLSAGEEIALVLCDHLLPGTSGVEFLVALNADERTVTAREVLVTGQAGLEDTIKAVNEASLHHYIAKPWTRDQLQEVSRTLLTDYVIDEEEDLLPFTAILDSERIFEAISTRGSKE